MHIHATLFLPLFFFLLFLHWNRQVWWLVLGCGLVVSFTPPAPHSPSVPSSFLGSSSSFFFCLPTYPHQLLFVLYCVLLSYVSTYIPVLPCSLSTFSHLVLACLLFYSLLLPALCLPTGMVWDHTIPFPSPPSSVPPPACQKAHTPCCTATTHFYPITPCHHLPSVPSHIPPSMDILCLGFSPSMSLQTLFSYVSAMAGNSSGHWADKVNSFRHVHALYIPYIFLYSLILFWTGWFLLLVVPWCWYTCHSDMTFPVPCYKVPGFDNSWYAMKNRWRTPLTLDRHFTYMNVSVVMGFFCSHSVSGPLCLQEETATGRTRAYLMEQDAVWRITSRLS